MAIFCLHFFLIMAGYAAIGVLLGSYMMRYGHASELDLGFIFMIQPITIFFRPVIGAMADRYQSHKQLYLWSMLINWLSYVVFILLPFLIEKPQFIYYLTPRVCFWILTFSHVIGSFSLCGIRSLGDALAVNYAKRIGSDYTCYRKYGAISFGGCGFLLGQINQGWILPDFVPQMILYVISIAALMVLVYLWPDEFFVIVGDQHGKQVTTIKDELPSRKEILAHMGSKLYKTIFFCCESTTTTTTTGKTSSTTKANDGDAYSTNFDDDLQQTELPFRGQVNINNNKQSQQLEIQKTHNINDIWDTSKNNTLTRGKPLSIGQQFNIFLLLVRRDIRISLYLLLILYCGLSGYSPQNYVFTYMNEVCHETGTCDAASLAGLTMVVFCTVETFCYLLINANRTRISPLIALGSTLISLAIHYYFYGFLLPHLSPYFFLVESLHGFEYSVSIWCSVELGYRFANEVELLIPELVEKGVINEQDDHELVKLSLMATMSACFTLVYDGAGSMIGAFLYGLVTDNYTFITTWKLIGTLNVIGLLAVIIVVLIGKCFHVRPQILKLKSAAVVGSIAASV